MTGSPFNNRGQSDPARQLRLILLFVSLGCAIGLPVFWGLLVGPLAAEMAIHIGLMSVAAPIVAASIRFIVLSLPFRTRWLWAATILQLIVLWSLHLPSVHHAMMLPGLVRAFSLAALFVVATGFWLCLLARHPSSPPWQDILALLLTAKLACLLAVLLIFAPRELYAHAHGGGMADQQAAGLLMLVACPLSYLVPAIFLAARLLSSTVSGVQEAILSARRA